MFRHDMNTIEELSLNAWPAYKYEMYDGWMIRYSHCYTHRTNCVTPIAPSQFPLEEKIPFCENVYKNASSPCIFKLSPVMEKNLDPFLEAKGYHIEHTTDVYVLDMKDLKPMTARSREYETIHASSLPSYVTYEPNILVQLSDRITPDWIQSLFRLNGTTNPDHLRIVPSMYQAIPKPTIAAHIEIDGRTVASGLGILDRDYVGLYAIYVDLSCRKKHFGRAICSTLLTEAARLGSKYAYLQVVKGNEPARRLYESLGMNYFYTYWFRCKPERCL